MKLKALVVDDSRVMRNVVMQCLSKTGLAEFEFTEAEDGDDALGKFNRKEFDILFVDWNMPKLTGIDLVRKIRDSGKTEHIPIVMVTSEKSMGKIEQALDEAGADEYITKPFTVDELTRKVNKVIQKIPATTAASPAVKPAGFFSKLLGGG